MRVITFLFGNFRCSSLARKVGLSSFLNSIIFFCAPAVVTVVIQGGPNTLKTAVESVKAGNPIVVIAGSGQAADILAYAWNYLHSGLSQYSTYTLKSLQNLIASTYTGEPKEKQQEFLDNVLEAVQIREMVSEHLSSIKMLYIFIHL